jgi:hypothetical protein
MNMHEETLAETIEVLLEFAETGKVNVVALPELLRQIRDELAGYEERIAALHQSILWYGGLSQDIRPLITAESLEATTI